MNFDLLIYLEIEIKTYYKTNGTIWFRMAKLHRLENIAIMEILSLKSAVFNTLFQMNFSRILPHLTWLFEMSRQHSIHLEIFPSTQRAYD